MKKTLLLIATLLFTVASVHAQVFLQDLETTMRESVPTGEVSNETFGYLAPLSEGLFLLTAIGGVYLLGKKKNQK